MEPDGLAGDEVPLNDLASPPAAPQAPQSSLFTRVMVVFLSSMLMFGPYLAYDSVTACAPVLKADWNFTESQVGALYSVYSLPNIFTVYLGGALVDAIGLTRAGLLFSALVALGNWLVFLGPALTSQPFWYMALGRFIYGVGAESLVIVQSAVLTLWFQDRELGVVYGISLSFARVGSITSLSLFPTLVSGYHWSLPLVLLLPALASSMCIMWVALLHWYGVPKSAAKSAPPAEEAPFLASCRTWPPALFAVAAVAFCIYGCVFTFLGFSTLLLTEKYGKDDKTAGWISSIIPTACLILSPFLGYAVDRFGHRVTLMGGGTLVMVPMFALLAFTHLNPIVPISVIALAFAAVPASLWPAIALLSEPGSFGREYGFTTCVQNLGLTIFPLVVGYFNDRTDGYMAGLVFLALMSVVGAAACVACYWLDVQRLLQAPAAIFMQPKLQNPKEEGGTGEETTPMREAAATDWDGVELQPMHDAAAASGARDATERQAQGE